MWHVSDLLAADGADVDLIIISFADFRLSHFASFVGQANSSAIRGKAYSADVILPEQIALYRKCPSRTALIPKQGRAACNPREARTLMTLQARTSECSADSS